MQHNRRWNTGQAAAIGIGMVFATTAAAPLAADVLSHKYDSQGRLIQVCNALTDDGELTRYSFDAADNRSTYTNKKTDHWWPADTEINSLNGTFSLRFQSDGNLVLYQNPGTQGSGPGSFGIWASNTSGSGGTGAYFQSDGNLVIYSPSQAIWSIQKYSPCARLEVQNNGNVVVFSDTGQVVWETGTRGR